MTDPRREMSAADWQDLQQAREAARRDRNSHEAWEASREEFKQQAPEILSELSNKNIP